MPDGPGTKEKEAKSVGKGFLLFCDAMIAKLRRCKGGFGTQL
jgi:hypothetical protein